MALPNYNISFHKGETYTLSITYKDSAGCPLNLSSGFAAKIDGRLTASTGDPAKWTATSGGGSANSIALSNGSPNIKLTRSDAYTGGLDVGSGVWDLYLDNTGANPDTSEYLLGGSYTIVDPVTPGAS